MARKRTSTVVKADSPEARARQRVKRLWQNGDLFHVTTRYPRSHPRRPRPRVDRLAGILKHGIIAPAHCEDGAVVTNLDIVVEGADIGYDRLVFLHQYDDRSFIYTICEPGRCAFFIDPAFPVMTQDDMGRDWCILCQDEVYVRERIPAESLIGLAVYPSDGEAVLKEFVDDFRRLALPLYTYEGRVLWPPK